MIKKKMLLLVIMGIFCLFPFVAGCLNLDKAYPEKRYFTLETSREADISSPDTGKILTVRRFRVSPKFEGKGLVYRLEELSYDSDFYNEFFISPSSMLTEEVRKRLAGSGLFKQVLNPTSLLDSTYILEGAVTALYGDYRVSTAPKAVMEIQFFLLEETDNNLKIIFKSQYHKEEPFKANMPGALVKSWNTVFNQILTEFETDLKEYLSKTDP
jgi:cholesterol transport system auxiliary component